MRDYGEVGHDVRVPVEVLRLLAGGAVCVHELVAVMGQDNKDHHGEGEEGQHD